MMMKKTRIFISWILVVMMGTSYLFAQDPAPKKDTVSINNKSIQGGTYEARSTINATGTINKQKDQVIFKAGEGITLGTGFSSKVGSDVIIKIEAPSNSDAKLEAKGKVNSVVGLEISPNPFKYDTTISFSLAKKEVVDISIYDASDKLIRRLLNMEKNEGAHQVEVDGGKLNSGVYKVVLKIRDAIFVEQMIVLR